MASVRPDGAMDTVLCLIHNQLLSIPKAHSLNCNGIDLFVWYVQPVFHRRVFLFKMRVSDCRYLCSKEWVLGKEWVGTDEFDGTLACCFDELAVAKRFHPDI